MERWASVLSNSLTSGSSLEEALAELKHQGASPAEAIKAIHIVQGVDLGEAKQIFSFSPAWALEVTAAASLHQEIMAALPEEKINERS